MKSNYYAIKDAKTGYMGMFEAKNDAQARRMITVSLEQDTMLNRFAKDYALYRMCSLDTETGVVESDLEFLSEVEALKEL